MLKNQNIICISSIDWDFIWQGHQEIMATLSKNGNRVLFIENTGVRMPRMRDFPRIKKRIKNWFLGVSGIREESTNLYIFSPIVLPFPYLRLAQWINRHITFSILGKWIKAMHFVDSIVWTFLPTPLSLSIIDNLDGKVNIYYCVDSIQASSNTAKKIKKSEINLLKKADLVFVTSKQLYDYCSNYSDKVHIFPFAVNFEEFERARLNKNYIIDGLKDIKRPIVGYVGGLHKWVDLDLIKAAARKYPEYSFIFVGPIQTNVSSLSGINNIYFMGQKDHKEIPYFISSFDVCIIPYLRSEYTDNVYPTKLNEYLAMGKPVISTELPEIINFNKENDNLILVGKTYEEFINCIATAICDSSDALVRKRISCARINSWATRIEEMATLIEEAIDIKSRAVLDWQKSFLKFYRRKRRAILNTIFISLSIYLLVFYTPLVWFFARPLKISQTPEGTDAIVVFAGGVGESGRAGQGFEERVKYAAELYNRGYAKYIIFSSGYTYTFKEPLVMKALAVSLGVPETAVILEDKAGNTFENVKFSKEILVKNKWDKLILISSPYNMRRASMVFNKIAPEITVIYSPPQSRFYAHVTKNGLRKQINMQQIRGILHEYLGIVYYWFKGYV